MGCIGYISNSSAERFWHRMRFFIFSPCSYKYTTLIKNDAQGSSRCSFPLQSRCQCGSGAQSRRPRFVSLLRSILELRGVAEQSAHDILQVEHLSDALTGNLQQTHPNATVRFPTHPPGCAAIPTTRLSAGAIGHIRRSVGPLQVASAPTAGFAATDMKEQMATFYFF
jgi:hypothetical protein